MPAIPDTSTGEMVPLTPELVAAWLDGDDIVDDAEPTDELDYATALRILGASDEAAALKPDDVRKSDTMVDKSFVVTAVRWRKSTKSDDGKGRFAIMSCVDEDNNAFVMSCGATKVVLQLRKAQLEGWFPWQVQLASDTTTSGNTVLSLVAPDKPF